ncbi:carbon-nitrogen hydrolase family protein [Leifsonia poae]|uniref:carbon-nitrogen hydrolase family protein n=1 Tax=Leifsonia poae TaxID=110933 RepID=UPI001CBE5E97|nr:carbon-nitrogen hydrolase family protein [Leifsonia poae]
MLLSLAQIASGTDIPHNLNLVRDAVRGAADTGSDLVLLPEYAMYEKKMVDATFASAAEPLDGPFGSAVADLAARHGIAVVVGMVESNPAEQRPFNTLAAFGADGSLLAAYRKIHLFDSYGFTESAWIAPAPHAEAVTFETGGARVGLMTCYDLRFPELGRRLAEEGADLVALCSSWVPGEHKVDQWRTLTRARAIENGYTVASVSQTPPVSIGRSLVSGPAGEVLLELGDGPQLGSVRIDPDATRIARERDPMLANRRFRVSPDERHA